MGDRAWVMGKNENRNISKGEVLKRVIASDCVKFFLKELVDNGS
jgi:hypothetical protein